MKINRDGFLVDIDDNEFTPEQIEELRNNVKLTKKVMNRMYADTDISKVNKHTIVRELNKFRRPSERKKFDIIDIPKNIVDNVDRGLLGVVSAGQECLYKFNAEGITIDDLFLDDFIVPVYVPLECVQTVSQDEFVKEYTTYPIRPTYRRYTALENGFVLMSNVFYNPNNGEFYHENVIFPKKVINLLAVSYGLMPQLKNTKVPLFYYDENEDKIIRIADPDEIFNATYNLVIGVAITAYLLDRINNQDVVLRERRPKKETITSTVKNNSSDKTSSSKSITIGTLKVKYINKGTYEKVRDMKKRKKCDYSFTVHGHYRKYRDEKGNVIKTVYIKPYMKNKDKPFKSHVYNID